MENDILEYNYILYVHIHDYHVVYSFPFLNIRFSEYDRERWGQLVSQGCMEILPSPDMEVTADKGFNFSSADNNFIVQKKNHFQVIFVRYNMHLGEYYHIEYTIQF